jgi:hypothetical protein
VELSKGIILFHIIYDVVVNNFNSIKIFTYGIYLVHFSIVQSYNCQHQSFKFWHCCTLCRSHWNGAMWGGDRGQHGAHGLLFFREMWAKVIVE